MSKQLAYINYFVSAGSDTQSETAKVTSWNNNATVVITVFGTIAYTPFDDIGGSSFTQRFVILRVTINAFSMNSVLDQYS